jgi:xanthosine utilization system XapX-like protein
LLTDRNFQNKIKLCRRFLTKLCISHLKPPCTWPP